MKLKAGSQNVKLLIELVRGNEVSRLPALTKLKVQNFQARISDIKKDYHLDKIIRTTKNGRNYTAYVIADSYCRSAAGKALNALKRQARARRAS